MSEINPYKPPESHVADIAVADTGNFIADGRAVDAGHGWDWIAAGFGLFKQQPGIWILVLIVLVACSVLVSIVPVIGPMANILLMQVLMGGVMLGCRALDSDGSLEVGHVFAGFKQNTGDLMVLGVLALVGWVIAFIPAIIIGGGGTFLAMMRGGEHMPVLGTLGLAFVLALLVVFALALPLYMALWFAPSLIVFNNLKPLDAMKASFSGCLKNIVPFMFYSIVLLVLCVLAMIPLGLGFLVMGPVIVASIYTGYRDIFYDV